MWGLADNSPTTKGEREYELCHILVSHLECRYVAISISCVRAVQTMATADITGCLQDAEALDCETLWLAPSIDLFAERENCGRVSYGSIRGRHC